MLVELGSGSYQISMAAMTVQSEVYASSCWMFFAKNFDRDISGSRYTVREGVLMLVATLMISFRHGTPRVTFLLETPA